jgi:hypothetical protein
MSQANILRKDIRISDIIEIFRQDIGILGKCIMYNV